MILFCFFIFFNIPSKGLLILAQDNEAPFSTFKTSFNMISVTNKNLLHRFWDSERGFKFSIEAPFYSGNIQTGMIMIPFKGKYPEYPDFNEYMIFVGWGGEVLLPFNFSLSGNLNFGYFIMNYDSDSLSVFQRNESEFSAGAGLSLSYAVIKNLFVSAGADLNLLFTNEKLKFYYISAGIAYRFNSPEWLRNFFN